MSKIRVLHSAIIVFSMIAAVLVSLLSVNLDKYYLIGFLPLTYSILLLIFPKLTVLSTRYIGLGILYVVLFVRYTITPLFIVFTERAGTSLVISHFSNDYLNKAILLMVYELVVCILVVVFVGNKVLLKNKVKFSLTEIQNGRVNFVYIFIITISFLLILFFPSLLNNFQFISIDDSKLNTVSYFKGIDIRILLICKMALYLVLLKFLAYRYNEKNKNNIYFILALLLSFLYICIFTGENRTNIVVDLICVIAALWYCFSTKRKSMLIVISSFGLILLFTISAFRLFAPRAWRPDGGTAEINGSFFVNNLQIYVSGPENVAIGLQSIDIYNNQINLNTFFNDLFVWTGYLGNFLNLNQSNTTSFIFNLFMNGTDPAGNVSITQIVPMVSQGYAYFGFVGAPLFSVLNCLAIIAFDKFVCKAKSLDLLFVNVFLVVRLSLFLGLNATIILMFVFDKYFQLWFTVKINQLIKIRLKDRTDKT
ncbi:oligosaccharide repeat unit polymerase [Peribacillus frigoritolerans]|uniref:oligosaccharide repeat unit polymerase n=1 Tax=Peribacillus frigoritolerans TaxID=450367 RepID=UPI0007BF5FF4|nr:oligosaccharide repeat unit polymerase [Peribacillus frigoritolerans]